jgi:phenylacetate-CoA ligase
MVQTTHLPSASLQAIVQQTTQVPFYRRADWATALQRPNLKLQDLPRITKAELRQHSPHDLLPAIYDLSTLEKQGLIEEENTSGTSGASVRVIFGKTWWAEQELRALQRHPLIAKILRKDPNARRCVLTTPGCNGVSCFARWLNFEQRILGTSLFVNQSRIPFTIAEEKMRVMADEVRQWSPVFLDVDPVHGMRFALYCERNGLKFPSLRFIITSYEYTSVCHRRIMERVFQVPVINLYGSSETGHLLIEQANGTMTASPETAQLEIFEPNRFGVGQLLVTTQTNPYLPLLRYEIGDYISHSAEGYQVHGRVRDAVRNAQKEIVTTRQIDQAFGDLTGIAHYQLRQEANGTAKLGLMLDNQSNPSLSKLNMDKLGVRLQTLLGAQIDISLIDLIAPEDSGKFRLTVPASL